MLTFAQSIRTFKHWATEAFPNNLPVVTAEFAGLEASTTATTGILDAIDKKCPETIKEEDLSEALAPLMAQSHENITEKGSRKRKRGNDGDGNEGSVAISSKPRRSKKRKGEESKNTTPTPEACIQAEEDSTRQSEYTITATEIKDLNLDLHMEFTWLSQAATQGEQNDIPGALFDELFDHRVNGANESFKRY